MRKSSILERFRPSAAPQSLDLAAFAEHAAGRVPSQRAAALRLLRAAALPSLAALSLVVLWWSLRDVAGFEAQVSVLLALTFPHAGVVWLLDRRSGQSTPSSFSGTTSPSG